VPQPLLDPVTPFRYWSGDPALDFVNTVDWTTRGPELDRFTDYARLLEWAVGAGVIDAATSSRLARRARTRSAAARETVRQAVSLRATLERLFDAIVRRRDPTRWLEALNAGWLRTAGSTLALARAPRSTLEIQWPSLAEALELPLVVTAWRAASLLTSDDRPRLRRCGGRDCGWFFVDRSRNGLRRWCSMDACGTLEKSRQRATRRRATRRRATRRRAARRGGGGGARS
jgi:predicted RNA-binding Zn ribbon-like protein